MCIEGYPERNTPTILVYKDGEIRRQFVTLRELNGPRTKIGGEFHLGFFFTIFFYSLRLCFGDSVQPLTVYAITQIWRKFS